MSSRILMHLSIAVFVVFLSSNVFAQSDSIFCGTTLVSSQTQIGGDVITSFGTIKALFLLIDFPDDTIDVNNPTWPVGTGPNFLNALVDSTEAQNSGIYANLSTFFKDMSYGQFRMIGKAYHVQAPHALSFYRAKYRNAEAAYSARDAIQALDQTVDFADFDRWIDSPYNHTLGQDGVLDMVFICYRRWYICQDEGNIGLYCSSFKAEGWYCASLPSDVYVDGGARRISACHAVNALQMIQYPRFEHLVHEFGHAWGLNHQYAPGFWSLMGQRFPTNTPFMNSLERKQLGWIAFHDITSPDTASLRDFGTYGDAYRISLGNGEYFILENHQVVSQYDFPAIDGTRGLYILRQFPYQLYPYEGNLKVETARGRYGWTNPGWTIFPTNGVRVPIFKRGLSNRTLGFNDRDPLYAVDPITGRDGYYLLHARIDEITGQTVFGGFFRGDRNDAYNLNYCTVFSPWSNPSACLQSGTLSSIGFEVLPPSSSTFDIQFFIGNPLDASPSKPQDAHVSSYAANGHSYPRLAWAQMQEPDVLSGGNIVVERRTRRFAIYPWYGFQWTVWGTVGTLAGNSIEYIDYEITQACQSSCPDSVQYRIQARDATQKLSVYSDVAGISVYGLPKQGENVAAIGRIISSCSRPILTPSTQQQQSSMISLNLQTSHWWFSMFLAGR